MNCVLININYDDNNNNNTNNNNKKIVLFIGGFWTYYAKLKIL